MIRQVVLDTETTGLETSRGHRVIEIGCVEILNRRVSNNYWHFYLQPDREIESGAFEVHGIGNDFLKDKPRFHEVVDNFLGYIEGAELIIHNAPFDVGFLNHELDLLDEPRPRIDDICTVMDTLVMARQKHPGQKNSLDALCKRYEIDNSARTLHGALLDAEILAEVYLIMTGGQTVLSLDEEDPVENNEQGSILVTAINSKDLPIWRVEEADQQKHRQYLDFLNKKADKCAW